MILIKNIVEDDETAGLIAGVGTSGEIKIPTGYKTVDINGGYVLPGLINAHCHLTGSGKPMKLMNLSDETLEKGHDKFNRAVERITFYLDNNKSTSSFFIKGKI